jgi:hypothetical protein
MGIWTRRQDDLFVISSDHSGDGPQSKRAPRRMSGPFQVWTGAKWSADRDEALVFVTLEDADEYVKTNYAKMCP